MEEEGNSSENARLKERYALTVNEQDPKKTVVLVRQTNQLLAAKEKCRKAVNTRSGCENSKTCTRPASGTRDALDTKPQPR